MQFFNQNSFTIMAVVVWIILAAFLLRDGVRTNDVIALAANPTVAQRLTGADPARIRAVARTASSTEDLPPADELYAQLADVLGVG